MNIRGKLSKFFYRLGFKRLSFRLSPSVYYYMIGNEAMKAITAWAKGISSALSGAMVAANEAIQESGDE